MRRLLLTVAAIGAVVYFAAPPAARRLPPPPGELPEPVRGAIHIHTTRSDGTGTVEEVARAASRAGLRFVILTDHGDALRAPDSPAYHGDVLAIDAVEISTDGGHVVALGLPAAPYPLGGEVRDVLEDVGRLGGFAIAAHPASTKPDLRWTDWAAPIGGVEWLNFDSEWRDESVWRLARVLLAYPVRPAETLGLVLDRSDEVLRRWDALTRGRRVVAVAAADAHARIGLRAQEPYAGRLAIPLPGYEAIFRTFSIALPQVRLSGDAAVDARAIVDEIRAGRVFSAIDALAASPAFSFVGTSGAARAHAGEVLAIEGPVRLEVRVQAPADVRIALVRDGVHLLDARGPTLEFDAEPKPASYRIEVRQPGAPGEPPVPWIVSNPIYVGRPIEEGVPAPRSPAAARVPIYADGPPAGWTVEHSSASQAAVDTVKAVRGTQLLFRYAVSGPAASHPYAALVVAAGDALRSCDRLTFVAQADRQMRLSVQLRVPGEGGAGERWHRSVFVDTAPREIAVFFDDMRPRGPTRSPQPPLDRITSVLFVVDTVNTQVGTSGRVFLDEVRCER